MDPTVVYNRLKDLDSILKYTNKTEGDIILTLQSLGWSKDGITKAAPLVECPINKSHMIPPSKISSHSAQCQLKAEQYNSDDRFLPDNCQLTNNTYFIDTPKMTACLTADRVRYSYSREERLAMYDGAIAHSSISKPSTHLSLLQDNQPNSESTMSKTYLEELSLMRDLKRRRSKYKVSTKSKTYTEIIRQVIVNQMDLYKDYIRNEEDTTIKNKTINNESNTHNDRKRPSYHDGEKMRTDNVSQSYHDYKKRKTESYDDRKMRRTDNTSQLHNDCRSKRKISSRK